MRNRLVQKLCDALIVLCVVALVSYFMFLAFGCISWLWNQNDFLLACSSF